MASYQLPAVNNPDPGPLAPLPWPLTPFPSASTCLRDEVLPTRVGDGLLEHLALLSGQPLSLLDVRTSGTALAGCDCLLGTDNGRMHAGLNHARSERQGQDCCFRKAGNVDPHLSSRTAAVDHNRVHPPEKREPHESTPSRVPAGTLG